MKLVRDLIPELYPGNRYRVSRPEEWADLIKAKLLEEASEVTEARTREEVTEELADLQEVIYAYARIFGIDFGDVIEARIEKRLTRGNFRRGYVMEDEA